VVIAFLFARLTDALATARAAAIDTLCA